MIRAASVRVVGAASVCTSRDRTPDCAVCPLSAANPSPQVKAVAKSPLYRAVLEREGLWDVALQQPLAPFRIDGRGTISLTKRDRDADDDLARIWKEVDRAHREAKKCSDKVMFHDGEGLQVPTPAYQHRHTASPPRSCLCSSCALTRGDGPASLAPQAMLSSMTAQADGAVENERRALVISNFTRTSQQKNHLARCVLGGRHFDERSVAGLFVIVFAHDFVTLKWRAADHAQLDVLNAIRDA